MTITHPVAMYDNRFCAHIDSPLYNGRLDPHRSPHFGFGMVGCPYRGTTTCYHCKFQPAAECDYKCSNGRRTECEHRAYCKCGHDQTHRLEAWGVLP